MEYKLSPDEKEMREEYEMQLRVLEIAKEHLKADDDKIRLINNMRATINNHEKVRRARNANDYFLSKVYIMTFEQIDALTKKILDYLYMIGE